MMSSFRFAKVFRDVLKCRIFMDSRPILLKNNHLSIPTRLCSSAPRPSEEDLKSVYKSPKSNDKAIDGSAKIINLAEKPIQSRNVPKVIPSSHVTMFEQALSQGRTRENFIEVLDTFNRNNRPRRGHMELLKISLEFMDRFGLEGDLEVYNALLNVFPRERFQNKTLLDAIWPKKHPQVDIALEILTKMEENVIKPSLETYELCEEIFGKASQPLQKCRRLAYWFTKLEEMFPHPLPKVLPEDEVELSKLALTRMSKDSIPIVLYQKGNEEKGLNFIVGSQTSNQKLILETYDIEKPVYVEGPHFLWMRRLKRHFYTLRSHHFEGKDEELEDGEGAILAVCMTNTNFNQQDTLKQWITRLQEQTPNLANIKIIFNLQHTEPEHLKL